ncbi:hypothetical protein RFI_00003 [Reticulomyxa filosa]|uniref:Uncharacterized protein n=1 Tax=Reticulomyxa filosa TaxID=46433 RepID=X6PFQ7_RETFI|nr:hypothetical protein RFI_00003 [Reticulomyxa filosa]|eukprot:ETO37061.1 hypothetical protein RFI_00003 [Reticulomyxa filosa]
MGFANKNNAKYSIHLGKKKDFSFSGNSKENDFEKLQQQHESLKLVLARIQSTFGQGMGEVNDLLNQWKSHLDGGFLTALTTTITNIQEKIKHIVTQDPNSFQNKLKKKKTKKKNKMRK